MARVARVVIPGLPNHITQRCNRRQQTFCNLLKSAMPEEELSDIRHHQARSGRPLGDETFLARLEGMQERGPKPKDKVNYTASGQK